MLTRDLPELGWRLVVEQDTSELVRQLNGQLALTQSVEQERRSGFEKATEQLFDNIYELDITNNRPANKVTEEYFEGLGTPPWRQL